MLASPFFVRFSYFLSENINISSICTAWAKMKVTALEEHTCYCCGETIEKEEICFAFIVNSRDPRKNEFDVVYTCSKCVDKENCQVRIKKKGANS